MIVESFPRYALQNTQTFIGIVSMFIRLSKNMHFHKSFEELFTKGQVILETFSLNLSRNIRAVHTRENNPRLTIAVAYLRSEGNHLYEHGLHKTRTTSINGSRLVRGRKAKRLALVGKIAIFYCLFRFKLTFRST